jgi:hypothetical protein
MKMDIKYQNAKSKESRPLPQGGNPTVLIFDA